ncbi:MAG: hypothetical protein U0U46_17060 [Saprospiraceae bacterium]
MLHAYDEVSPFGQKARQVSIGEITVGAVLAVTVAEYDHAIVRRAATAGRFPNSNRNNTVARGINKPECVQQKSTVSPASAGIAKRGTSQQAQYAEKQQACAVFHHLGGPDFKAAMWKTGE